jgi:hypothetical protein
MQRLVAVLAALAVSASSGATAQTVAQTVAPDDAQSDASDAPDIIVEGGRSRANIYRRLLGRAAISDLLPRWQAPVCLRVIGMEPRAAEPFRQRIEMAALQAGARVGRPGCDPNVVIAWTSDGPDMAQRIYHGRARMMTEVPRPIRDRFLNGDDAVRWVPVAVIGADGGSGAEGSADAAIPIEGGAGSLAVSAPSINGNGASLIRTTAVAALASVTVVIDVNRASGVGLNALADYVALVALSGMPMGGRDGMIAPSDSILALFEAPDRRAVDGMTAADRAYLSMLYSMAPNRTARSRRGRLVAAIERGLAEAEAGAANEP